VDTCRRYGGESDIERESTVQTRGIVCRRKNRSRIRVEGTLEQLECDEAWSGYIVGHIHGIASFSL
jgi:hypothetical protein